MKITAIKAQVKTPDRYSIFVDHKYSFSLSGQALLEAGLVNQQVLGSQDLARFKEQAGEDKLYGLTLKWLMRRLRSAQEVNLYLKQKKADQALANKIVSRLTNLGLIDDLKFAQALVSDRTHYNHASRRRVGYELRRKGISQDIIDLVTSDSSGREVTNLKKLVELKRRQSRYRDDLKLMQYLSRQGFNYGEIKQALSDLDGS